MASNRRGFLLAGLGGAAAAAVPQITRAADSADHVREAKAAIAEQLARYCRAWDRGDIDLALTVWHPDGTAQYLAEPITPVAVLIPQRLEGRRKTGLVTTHQVTNMLVEVKGDRAVSEAYGIAMTQSRPTAGEVVEHQYASRYLDTWSRRDGHWAIDHRRVVLDSYSRKTFAPDPAVEPALGAAKMGTEDPSYAHFASLKD